MKNGIVLCSGGLDSVTTGHYVKSKGYGNLLLLFFDYGQRNVIAERKFSKQCARDLRADFKEIKIRELKEISPSFLTSNKKANKLSREDLRDTKEEAKNWYVPFRNGIFLSYAVALAESFFIKDKKKFDVFVGFKNEGEESYPDTTISFVRGFNALQSIRVIAPLINKDKEDIVKLGDELGVDFKKTHSCYTSNKHCGSCLSCMLRKEGFHWSGVKDPSVYF
jgi:7-cyano-7-deazaguanine synthase